MAESLPTQAGILPPDRETLFEFVEEYRDSPCLRLTYVDDGETRTCLLRRLYVRPPDAKGKLYAAVMEAYPLAPDESSFRLRTDDIELLEVVALTATAGTASPETRREMARVCRLVAEQDPDAADVSAILSLLDRDPIDEGTAAEAVRALRMVAEETPEACLPAVPILRSLLGKDAVPTPEAALRTLHMIAEADPPALASAAEVIIPHLDSDEEARKWAAACLDAVAVEFPEDVVPAVDGLASLVADRASGWAYAIHALAEVADSRPAAVEPVAETVQKALFDDTAGDGPRMSAAMTLGRMLNETSVTIERVAPIVDLLEAENTKLRNNGVALLHDIATVNCAMIEPHADDLVPLLTADDTYTRVNASGALARVAEEFPRSAGTAYPTIVALLTDVNELARQNACWLLGHLEACEAGPALEKRALYDEHEDVRLRATWALDALERADCDTTPESIPDVVAVERDMAIEHTLATVPLPEPRADCLDAVRAVREYIRDEEGATRDEILRDLEPLENHPIGHNGVAASAKGLGGGFEDWWWAEVVEPGLSALPDIDAPSESDGVWATTTSDASHDAGPTVSSTRIRPDDWRR